MDRPKVILIGGAPLVGKTALARTLASTFQYQCLGTDDLGAAITSVTTAHSHPYFHHMSGRNFQQYYTAQSAVQLIIDAERYHEALWPAIETVIRNHATYAGPIILEGWGLQPERIARLRFTNIASAWLVAPEQLYERRLRQETDFLANATDPDTLVRHFVRRSVWYDRYIRKIAHHYKLPILEVSLDMTPQAAYAAVHDLLGLPRSAAAG